MNTIRISFASIDMARSIVQNLYPNARNITMVESGSENLAALIDKKHAVRFPQDQSAYARSRYELHVLKQMETADTLTVPRLADTHDDPPYMITSYVPGHHRHAEEIQLFSTEDQEDFAKQLARFTYVMHQTLKPA